jgi:pilus assembly protein Flp/PilA
LFQIARSCVDPTEQLPLVHQSRIGTSRGNPGKSNFKRSLSRFFADESGATAIEYGLIAAGIALAIIAVVNGLGSNLNNKFTSINTSLK